MTDPMREALIGLMDCISETRGKNAHEALERARKALKDTESHPVAGGVNLDSAIQAHEESQDWYVYRDHEKRAIAFRAGVEFGATLQPKPVAVDREKIKWALIPIINKWADKFDIPLKYDASSRSNFEHLLDALLTERMGNGDAFAKLGAKA